MLLVSLAEVKAVIEVIKHSINAIANMPEPTLFFFGKVQNIFMAVPFTKL